MTTVHILTSISSMVLKNGLFNSICKKDLTTNDHKNRFNILMYAVCILLFGIGVIGESFSYFTLLLGIVFGIVTALSNFYQMKALSDGPMHITLLITTSSMIIPTMSGVFFGEKFSFYKLIAVMVLIWFIYLSLGGKGDQKKINKKWLLFVFLAFLFQGSIGVLQKIHQASEHKAELNGFLLVAFVCSLIYSRIRSRKTFKALNFRTRQVLIAVVCGICTYAMNVLNLRLSGMLPSQLFFPLINGSSIVLTSLVSIFLFKEKISKKQAVGLCGGILSLIAICLVP